MPTHAGPPAPRRPIVVVWLLAASLLVPGPLPAWGQTATPTAPAAPLVVAASTPIFADIVANVGGERVASWSVIPAGADPHTWEATPREIVRVTESDTFISMGADLEPFVEAGGWRRAVRDAGIPHLELADQVALIAVDRVIDHGDHVHDLRGGDPHVWLDPLKTLEVVDAIAAHLSTLDPAGAIAYGANATAYRTELIEMDAAYQAGVALIPPERRKLVVFHDAYTYFAVRYGFTVVGVVLPAPDGDPSARHMAELIATIEREGIEVVFAEPQFDPDLLETVVAETGVTVGLLMTDTFAGDVDTYLELMRFNLDSLRRHLGPPLAITAAP